MKCNWKDCDNEGSCELPTSLEDGRIDGYETYCNRHFRKAIVLQDAEVQKELAEYVNSRLKTRSAGPALQNESELKAYAKAIDDYRKEQQGRAKERQSAQPVLEPYGDDMSLADAFKQWQPGININEFNAKLDRTFGIPEGALGDMFKRKPSTDPVQLAPVSSKKKWLWIGVGLVALGLLVWMFTGVLENSIAQGVVEGVRQAGISPAPVINTHAVFDTMKSTVFPAQVGTNFY